jgi:N-acetylmuramic acid 6-phosphate etherase
MPAPVDLGHLLTEQRNPATAAIDSLSTLEMCRVMNEQDSQVAAAVGQVLPQIAAAIDAISSALAAGGRLLYIGAGTSGRLGVLDASECPPTFNVPPGLVVGIIAGGDAALRLPSEGVEDSAEAGVRDLRAHNFSPQDVLCGIAASGRTPYVLGAIEEANRLQAVTIGLACSPASPLARAARIAIEPLTGPETITGSTRMRAGTATKLVLNMLSTGAMIRLGYVYSNLMVNVQPTNEKLIDRAQRILMEAAGIARDEAARVLEDSGRNVRTALVMASRHVPRNEAEALLAAAHGRVREALEAPPADQ